MKIPVKRISKAIFAGLAGLVLVSGTLWADPPEPPKPEIPPPPSLKTVPIPEPPNLYDFLRGNTPEEKAAAKAAAVRLGKALFWDMQVGSDGIQACASCHFNAGADNRVKNTLSPGGPHAGDTTFNIVGPNGTLLPSHFPFHKLTDPNFRVTDPLNPGRSTLVSDSNDVVSSQGVRYTHFVDIVPRNAKDKTIPLDDPVFQVTGREVRRAPGRNTPSVINAVFYFTNFWDGRANNIFNGANPFGASDPTPHIWVNNNGILEQQLVRIPNASLASQAVGPPLSDFEMSGQGRTFAKLGKKMLSLKPLAKQLVHPQDSVLGPLSLARLDSRTGRVVGVRGLRTNYSDMIKAVFQDKYWDSTAIIGFTAPKLVDDQGRRMPLSSGAPTVLTSHLPVARVPLTTNQFTQMEANFSLFFGLAIMMYESTLVSDDTPYDRFRGVPPTANNPGIPGDPLALAPEQKAGFNLFMGIGVGDANCILCHGGAEFTNHSFTELMGLGPADPLEPPKPPGLLPIELMLPFNQSLYDGGFYNIGVRPTQEDLGRGGTDPFGYPLSFTRRFVTGNQPSGDIPLQLPCGDPPFAPCPNPPYQVTVDGTFKVPGLRNVELTGPYFHNGGKATLRQVVDFYARGGDFREQNLPDVHPLINNILELQGFDLSKDFIVDFLLALTDERVRWEQAPFDHPELLIPHGSPAAGAPADTLLRLPAVGAAGRAAAKLPPLKSYLGLSPYQP